jgi:integrase/recombinase XerD
LRDLASSVPVIPSFRLAGLPQALAKEDIEKILGAVDRSTPVGRRDYSMLLILATYGIRGGQLCALKLEDIGWRRETLRVRAAKGGREAILPLLDPVAEALIDYLRNGRPRVSNREIFLRVRPPLGPLGGSLGQIIKPYARRAGVKVSCLSPRAWRHGFASKMVAHGQALKNISDMMGHRSVESTYIYTKVDIELLRQAALDWPEDVR